MKTPTSSILIDPIALELAARPQGVGKEEVHALLAAHSWISRQVVSTRLSTLARKHQRLVVRYVARRGSHDDWIRYFASEALADACPDVVRTKRESKVVRYTNPRTCGVKTLEDIRIRCWIDPESGCWVWRQSFSSHKGERGRPQCNVVDRDGKRRTVGAANYAWQLAGKEIPAGQVVYRAVCGNTACVNPEHGKTRTQSAHVKAMAKEGRFKPTLARKRAAQLRAVQTATPVEKVREVEALLEQGLTKRAIAATVGLTTCTVLKIARKRHVHSSNALHLLPSSSVFNLKVAS